MNKARITISRPSSNTDEEEYISLSITDENSRARFVRLKIPLADFSTALTGMAEVKCIAEYKGLQYVGKNRESMPLTFPMPDGSGFRDKDAAIAEAEKIAPAGWFVDNYFSSQSSFYKADDGKQWARTTAYRYVDVED